MEVDAAEDRSRAQGELTLMIAAPPTQLMKEPRAASWPPQLPWPTNLLLFLSSRRNRPYNTETANTHPWRVPDSFWIRSGFVLESTCLDLA
ncbi:hypothetical protein [Streptomyces sp. NPDC001415]